MSFTVYPAIDVRDGRVVRLRQGDYARETVYARRPAGAGQRATPTPARRWLHLVDLDAARAGGYTLAAAAARSIAAATALQVQTGGGVRTEADVEAAARGGRGPRRGRHAGGARAASSVAAWLAALRRRAHHARARYPPGRRRRVAPAGRTAGPRTRRAALDDLLRHYAERRPAPPAVHRHRARRHAVRAQPRPVPRRCAALARGCGCRPPAACASLADVARCATRRCAGAILGRALLEGRFTLPEALSMLSRRIIPCLDVRDGQVVKGVRFRDHVVMGAIEDLALRYRDEGADELVFYDITASPRGPRGRSRPGSSAWRGCIDIPFCVAGGIRSVEQARAVLHAGADKISVNSPALERPGADRRTGRGLRRAVRGGRHRQPARRRRRVARAPVHRRSRRRRARCRRRTLDWVREVAGPGRRRDRAQLHGLGRRAPAATTSSSCRRCARSAACRWWPRAAPARRRTSPTSSSRPMSMPRWPPACSTPATLPIPALKRVPAAAAAASR